MGPHDGRYKLFFSHRRMMKDLVRGFLGERWVRRLDLGTLERVPADFVSRRLRQRHGDCLWRVRLRGPAGARTCLYLLVEFQSKPDRLMPLRLLDYEVLLLEHLVREHELAPGEVLPPVIALVVHSGGARRQRWNSPLALRELFAPVPEEAARLLPAVAYLLIDPAAMDPSLLDQPDNVAAVFFRIQEARSPAELLGLARPLSRMLPEKREPELRQAFTELLVETLQTAFPEVRISHVKDLEELHMLEENRIRWRNSVLREGRRIADEGAKKALEKGLRQGIEQGQIEGMRRLLQKQMKLRFGSLPPAVRRKIGEISSMAELEELAGRLLTATTLQDLRLGSRE